MWARQLFFLLTIALGHFSVLSALTQEQVNFFWKNGYLVIENFLSEEEIHHLLDETFQLVDQCDLNQALTPFLPGGSYNKSQYFIESADKIAYFFETAALDSDGNLLVPIHQALNKIGHNLHDLNPTFESITYQKKFKDIPKDLGWILPSIIQSMVIFKQPLIGGAVPCHQDLTFLFTNPNTTLGLWMPLEDATLDNGCLWVVPGGHMTSLRQLFIKNEANDQTELITLDPTPLSGEGMIPVEMQKGSLLLIHSLLPHKSLGNRSSHSRIAYTFHLIDQTSEYPSNNWLQRSAECPLKAFE
jgi:phytanoyl-CoA hydroxylase